MIEPTVTSESGMSDSGQEKICVSGATGLIGGELVRSLRRDGVKVLTLVRGREALNLDEAEWNPEAGIISKEDIEGLKAFVHLSGENIASRWTEEKKRSIRNSREEGTRLIAKTLASLERPPEVLASASAIGYYGDRRDEELYETSSPGKGFLADVCREWEESTGEAAAAGIRVVKLRTGVVLSTRGGALKKMLVPFKAGLGGRTGSGRQFMSWVSIEDMVGIIRFVIDSREISGPVNIVSPNPVRNGEFSKTLAGVLRRPALFPLPAFAVKLIFGEMGKSVLLSSARVLPRVLLDAGYEFKHTDLEQALSNLLGN